MKRGLAVLAFTPLLWGCPKEQRDATVRWADGRPVFDGDREDCLSRVSVAAIGPGGDRTIIWSLESPMPISRENCHIRLPVTYGEAPQGVPAWPREALPPLEQGRRYALDAEGGYADHGVEFTVPEG